MLSIISTASCFNLLLSHCLIADLADKKYVNWNLRVASIHGDKAPLPFVKSVEVSFSENQNMKAAILDKQPLNLKRRTIRTANPFDILLKVNFGDGCKCLCTEIKIPVNFQLSTDCFEGDKNSIFERLRDRAMKDPSCGQTALIEKKAILVPKSEIMIHSIVTNIVEFGRSSEPVKECPLTSRLLKRQNGDADEIKISRKRSRSRKSSHKQ